MPRAFFAAADASPHLRSAPQPRCAAVAFSSGRRWLADPPAFRCAAGTSAGLVILLLSNAYLRPRETDSVTVDATLVATDARASRFAARSLQSGLGVVRAALLRADDVEVVHVPHSGS